MTFTSSTPSGVASDPSEQIVAQSAKKHRGAPTVVRSPSLGCSM